MIFLTPWELSIFRLVLIGKTDKEVPQSSRLGFLEKILANNFFYQMPKKTSLGN